MREGDRKRERLAAERQLRETSEQWSEVNDVSGRLKASRERGGEQFLADLAEAMRRRTSRREARP